VGIRHEKKGKGFARVLRSQTLLQHETIHGSRRRERMKKGASIVGIISSTEANAPCLRRASRPDNACAPFFQHGRVTWPWDDEEGRHRVNNYCKRNLSPSPCDEEEKRWICRSLRQMVWNQGKPVDVDASSIYTRGQVSQAGGGQRASPSAVRPPYWRGVSAARPRECQERSSRIATDVHRDQSHVLSKSVVRTLGMTNS